MKKKVQPIKISGVIGKILHSFGLSENYNGWLVVSKWSEIVGESLASRAKAIRFENGMLFVAIQDDVWRQEISMQIDQILLQIHSHPCGRVVKQIRLTRDGKDL